MCTIETETALDAAAIETLLDEGFGADRLARPAYSLRLGAPLPELCLVIRASDGTLSASIRFWEIRAGGAPALLLGPLVVASHLQGEGLGRALVRAALERARAAGWRLCFVVGNPGYYAPFGFEAALGHGYEFPVSVESSRFQVLNLHGGSARIKPGAVLLEPRRCLRTGAGDLISRPRAA